MKKQLLFSFLLILISIVYAQEENVWDYPVKPGTKEWAKFKTFEQKVRACQIPPEVLDTISTKELVAVCLDYPLFKHIYGI